jgi:rRNA-processing protein FCF1
METRDIVLLAVTLIILGEVSYLLAKLPKTSIKTKDRAILVDTSVLMDGRITNLAATGFIGGTLVVPRSVIGELQLLADQADADKRARARHGLDVVSTLQGMEGVEVEILQDGSKAAEGVDERLLSLAKQHSAVICTLDFNLNKVAVVEGIKVLNINELAQSLRMQHLPGEHMMIELTQKGQDSHQGVGYLSDGTMVVVEQSNKYIGQTVQVEVVRSLQTAAGKMMFARRVERHAPKKAETPAMVAAKTKSSGRSRRNDNNESAKQAHPEPQPQQTPQQPKQQQKPQKQQQPQQQGRTVQKKVTNQQKPRAVYHAARKRVNHEDSLLQLVDSQKDE